MPIRGEEELYVESEPRKHGRQWGQPALLAGLTGLTLALAVGWYVSRPPEPLARVRLQDGTFLDVMAVTIRGEHDYVEGTRLQKWLLPIVPSGPARQVGGELLDRDASSADGIVPWIRHPGTASPLATYGRRLASLDNGKGTPLDRKRQVNGTGIELAGVTAPGGNWRGRCTPHREITTSTSRAPATTTCV